MKRICYLTLKRIIIHPVQDWTGNEAEGDRLIAELNKFGLNAQYVTDWEHTLKPVKHQPEVEADFDWNEPEVEIPFELTSRVKRSRRKQ